MPKQKARQEKYFKRIRLLKFKSKGGKLANNSLYLHHQIVPTIAGFKRVPGSFNNVWHWKTMEDVKFN